MLAISAPLSIRSPAACSREPTDEELSLATTLEAVRLRGPLIQTFDSPAIRETRRQSDSVAARRDVPSASGWPRAGIDSRRATAASPRARDLPRTARCWWAHHGR